MTDDSLSSDPMMTRVESLKTELRGKGVEVDNLAFLSTGTDLMLGEVLHEDGIRVGREVVVQDPIRFMRLQRHTAAGVEVEFMLGSYDLIESGIILVIPTVGFFIKYLSAASQFNYYNLLLSFIQAKMARRAEDAGLIIQPSQISGLR